VPRRDGSPDVEPQTPQAPPDATSTQSTPTAAGDSYVPDPSRSKVDTGKTGESMFGKVGGKLADSYLFTDYGYRPPNLMLSSYAGLGFNVHLRPIKNDDGLVKGDPNRLRTTERIQKEGKGVTWTELRGAITPWVGVPLWVPAGPVNVNIGFSASAQLGISILAPIRHNVGEAVKNVSLKYPFDADTAKALTEGTELTLRGSGRLAVSAGTRVGDTWVPFRGPWSVGASIGTDSYLSDEHEISVRVKRLDGDKVFVSLAKVDTDGHGHAIGARAGLHTNLSDLADEYVPDSGNKLVDKGKDLAVRSVRRTIEKWLSAEVRAVYTASESERELKNYVIDLSKPEGKKAYEALMILDTRRADALDKQGPDSGVEAVWLTEDVDATHKEFNARLGRLDLVKSTADAHFAHGRLYTREGVLHYDRTTLDNRYQDIVTRWWKGRRETQRDFVSTRPNNGPHRLQLRLRNETKVDLSTPTADVRRFVQLASYLGARTPDPSELLKDEKFLASFGRSKRIADFALNDAGIKRLLSASDQQLMAAFAAGYEDLDRPWEMTLLFPWEKDFAWRTTPWLHTSHPQYNEVMGLLEAGPERGRERDGQTRDQDYFWITGRSLWQDAAAYEESKRLIGLITKIRNAPTDAARVKILKEESDEVGVDGIREFAMYAKIAGPDGLQIGELTLKDESRKKKIQFSTHGPIQDPRQVIDQWLANPDTGPATVPDATSPARK
jgi:hypothetical protein